MSNRRMGPGVMGPHKPVDKNTVKRLLGYMKPYWPRLLLVMVFIVLNAVATAAAAISRISLASDSETTGGLNPSPSRESGPKRNAAHTSACR